MKKIFITFANSIGNPVKVVDDQGKPALDAQNKVQFIDGLYRHAFIHDNKVCTVKCGEKILTGRVQLVEQEYQGNKYWTTLGKVSSAAEVETLKALENVEW